MSCGVGDWIISICLFLIVFFFVAFALQVAVCSLLNLLSSFNSHKTTKNPFDARIITSHLANTALDSC